jgi:hypothetical protein
MVAPITEERRAADLEAEAQSRHDRDGGVGGVGGFVDDGAATSNAGA